MKPITIPDVLLVDTPTVDGRTLLASVSATRQGEVPVLLGAEVVGRVELIDLDDHIRGQGRVSDRVSEVYGEYRPGADVVGAVLLPDSNAVMGGDWQIAGVHLIPVTATSSAAWPDIAPVTIGYA